MNGSDMIMDILNFFHRESPYDNAKGMSELVTALGPTYGKRALQEAVRTLVMTGWLDRNDFAENKTKRRKTPAPHSSRAREPPSQQLSLRIILEPRTSE